MNYTREQVLQALDAAMDSEEVGQANFIVTMQHAEILARELGVALDLLVASFMTSINSRTDDPNTSVQAGQRKAVQDVRRFSTRSQCAALLALFDLRPMTDHEATNEMFPEGVAITQFEGCRRRCSDLRRAGYLDDSGERRKNLGSPDDSIVWAVTRQGVEALAALDTHGWSAP